MKRIFTVLCALAIVMAGSATALAAEPEVGQSASYYPISVEEYTYGPLDELRVNKTYQLSYNKICRQFIVGLLSSLCNTSRL